MKPEWNKAEAEFLEEHARKLVYLWAQEHIAFKARGERFQVPRVDYCPYQEFAVFKKWISSEGYVLAVGLKTATSVARR